VFYGVAGSGAARGNPDLIIDTGGMFLRGAHANDQVFGNLSLLKGQLTAQRDGYPYLFTTRPRIPRPFSSWFPPMGKDKQL
jgi:hypothetical protein